MFYFCRDHATVSGRENAAIVSDRTVTKYGSSRDTPQAGSEYF